MKTQHTDTKLDLSKRSETGQRGFTIIEVVIVLAIAALIFLIVFLAVPALQRSQRDTQRRSDLGRFMSQVTQYQSNNGGQVPGPNKFDGNTANGEFVPSYLLVAQDTFKDPSTGVTYKVDYKTSLSGAPSDLGVIFYYQDASCANGTVQDTSPSVNQLRDVAVTMKLEGGGNYCLDNS